MSSKSKMKQQKKDEKGLSLPARIIIIAIAALMALSPVFSSCAMKRTQDEAAQAAQDQQLATISQINALYEGTANELEEKLAQDPDDTASTLSLASNYMNWAQMLQAFVADGSEADHAQELFEKAAALYETYAGLGGEEDVSLNLALCLFNSGDADEAASVLRALLEREPDNVAAWINLGILYEGQEDMAAAREAYERVLELDPENEQGAYNYARTQLENMGVQVPEAEDASTGS